MSQQDTLITIHSQPEQNQEDKYAPLRKSVYRLLRTCLSLDIDEKIHVIHKMDSLSHFQLTSLIEVFCAETKQFAALQQEHCQDILDLQEQRAEEWKTVVKSTLSLMDHNQMQQTTLH